MKSRTIYWSCTACVWKNTAVDIHRGDLYIGASSKKLDSKWCGNNTNKSKNVKRKGQLVPMRTYLFVFMVDIACVREYRA